MTELPKLDENSPIKDWFRPIQEEEITEMRAVERYLQDVNSNMICSNEQKVSITLTQKELSHVAMAMRDILGFSEASGKIVRKEYSEVVLNWVAENLGDQK